MVATAGDVYTGFKVGDGVFGLVLSPPRRCVRRVCLVPAHQLVRSRRCSPARNWRSWRRLTAYQALFEVARAEGRRARTHSRRCRRRRSPSPFQLAAQAGAQVFATASAANHEFVRSRVPSPLITALRDFRAVLGQPWTWCSIPPVSRPSSIRWRCWFRRPHCPPTSPDPLDVARERGFEAQWLTVHPDRMQMQEIARPCPWAC